jgi:tetratricopeptide (TPR) repeat protein
MKFILTIISVLVVLNLNGQQVNSAKILDEAQAAHANGRYKDAIAAYNQLLEKNPSAAQGYLGRASSKKEIKDLAGALTDYSIALELTPESYEARFGRANVFYKLRRYEEARIDYSKLLTLDPGETNYIYFQKSASPSSTAQITSAQSDIRPIVFNYLGLTEFQLKNFKQARVWLDSAIRLRPREADYYVNRGLVRRAVGDRVADEDFKTALKINPQHTAALTALANNNDNKNPSPSGSNYLDEAVESDTTVLHPYLERAFRRMQDGQYAEALSDYNHALQIEDADPEIWLNRGYVKEKLGDLKGAYSDLTRAITLKEDFAKAWLNRGNVLQKLGRFEDAKQDYSAAITYYAGYGAAYYNRAVVLHRLKKNREACSDIVMAETLGVQVDENLKRAVCP